MFRFRYLLATTALASGQVYTPPPADNSPKPPAVATDTAPGSSNPSNPNSAKSQGPLGSDLPFFDPSAETISWNGHTWAATDNRIVSARFERYLNEPEDNSEDARAYRETIQEILDKISPHHPGGPDFSAGLRLLPRASSFPADAKLCDTLSQAIYTAYLAKKDVAATRALNSAMEEEKQRVIRNADIIATGVRNGESRPVGPQGRNTSGQNNQNNNNQNNQNNNQTNNRQNRYNGSTGEDRAGTGIDSLRYRDSERRIDEIEDLKKQNATRGEIRIFDAKVQYQAMMMQFFVQRRFEHVVMAARFYNQIFKDGDSKLHIDKNSDMAKLFGESLGTSPTVSALDALANEAIRDVDQGVEAFKFLVEKKEYQSAAKRLSEAYLAGEFMPSIRVLPRTQKREVLEFVRGSYQLIAALDAKDYDKARELTTQLKASSGDFDATKAEAAIATYTRVSSMHIDAAKLAASQGNNEKAAQEIQKAMEVWPQNPKLAEFDQLVEKGSSLAVARNDFDRLLAEQNYREILNRQYEIAPAVHGDPKREEAFKQVITNLIRIDTALSKAKEFSNAGQDYAAWEQLATIRAEFEDDPKLGREMERLAPSVADFTKAIDNASRFERDKNQKQIGSALSWYLKAKSIYPRSEMAEAGINRMLNQILPSEGSSDQNDPPSRDEESDDDPASAASRN